MKKKLLAGLLSVVMLIGDLQPVLASDDADVTVSEEVSVEEDEESYEEYDFDGDDIYEDVTAKAPQAPAIIDKTSDDEKTITSKSFTINKVPYTISAEVSYYTVVQFCNRKIKAGTDLDAEVKCNDLNDVACDLLGVDSVDLSNVIEWKFTEYKNKKTGSKSYFRVKAKVKKSAAKAVGLKGKNLTRFKKAVSKLNSAAGKKAARMYFSIVDTIPKDGIEPTGRFSTHFTQTKQNCRFWTDIEPDF